MSMALGGPSLGTEAADGTEEAVAASVDCPPSAAATTEAVLATFSDGAVSAKAKFVGFCEGCFMAWAGLNLGGCGTTGAAIGFA